MEPRRTGPALCMPNSTNPVSYTHLDVYKRQVTELLTTSDAAFSKIAGYSLSTYEKEEDDIDAVSYTHLDVYKRQAIYAAVHRTPRNRSWFRCAGSAGERHARAGTAAGSQYSTQNLSLIHI